MHAVRRILLTLAWLAVAVVVALGGAGVATALNHTPGTDARPELTWTADQAAAPALDAATARLQALSDAVDALGGSSRQALASLVAGDTSGLTATLDAGTSQLATVSAAAAALQASLAAVPFTGDDAALQVSAATRARYTDLAATPALTKGLEADWAVLSARAMAASAVPDVLAAHDQQTAAALKEGEAGHYKQALALLDAPDATLARARQLRDNLAQNADVSTLTAWIDRQAAYDAALRQLYGAMLTSKGKVTSAVRAAFTAEEAAKAALPANTRGLVVIMGDIARGGLNQAVIDIEVARGALAAALAAQHPAPPSTAPQPSESAAPGESASPAAPTPAGSGRPEVTPPP